MTDSSCCAVQGVGLGPLACWDRAFESRRGQGCLPVVNVVSFQVQVSATSRSLVNGSPTEYVCVYVSDCTAIPLYTYNE